MHYERDERAAKEQAERAAAELGLIKERAKVAELNKDKSDAKR